MAQFKEATDRLFKDKFVCKDCYAVTKVSPRKVAEGEGNCRKCNSNNLRPKRRK